MISNMKIASVVVGALAAVAGAQDLSAFPQCAQWCINSMQQANKSQELGCGANDAACACRNPNFLYGVRDCSAQLCASFDTAGMAIGYANEYCSKQGVDLNTVTSGLPPQITDTQMPSGAVTTGSGAGSGTEASVTTSAILTTNTDVSTVDSTTITDGTAGGAGSSESSQTSTVPIVSTVTSDSSTFQTTIGSSTVTTKASGTDGANGATTGSNGAATTSSNPNYAAQMTAAPVGLLAAAGVAAFLL